MVRHERRLAITVSLVAALMVLVPAPPAPASAVMSPAAEAPGPPQLPPPPDFNRPNLQVSPELTEVRTGVAVELTATLYHEFQGPVDIAFEVFDVEPRPRHERVRPTLETARCTAAAPARSCTVRFERKYPTTAIVTAWIRSGPDARRDHDEGRLASLARPPLEEADCTLKDGEPANASCRSDQESGLSAGSAEPDGTDVVRIAWTGLPEADLDCDDDGGPDGTEVAVRGRDHAPVEYTCRATYRSTGEPMPGALLNAEIQGGPFDPDKGVHHPADYGNGLAADGGSRRLCTTTFPLGHCTFNLKIPGKGAGQALVCLWIDSDNDIQIGPDAEDGGGCRHEAVDEPEANDSTDTVEILFRESDGEAGAHSRP